MSEKNIALGQKFLVLRYSTNVVSDCIEKHSELINEYGFCWFGKIGAVPSVRIMREVYSEEHPKMLLYRKGCAFLCDIGEIIQHKPNFGYPQYYDTEGIYPSAYIKVFSIEPCQQIILNKSVVHSTGNYLLDTLYHSRIPFLLAEYSETADASGMFETAPTTLKREQLGPNDCRYRRNGVCAYRSCINYQYECDRPSTCAKQKR